MIKLWRPTNSQAKIALFFVVAVAVFLRFWQLDSLPPGLFPDEAANGLDVFRILEGGDLRPLYATNGPREALFFYLQAIFVALLGNTILALRIAPAIIGSLGVLVTYKWVKSWFGTPSALVAAFFMAASPWAITMSRIGFRASMVPLMIALTMWTGTEAVRSGMRSWAIAAGASVGLGLYTYLSFRMMPMVIMALMAYLFVFRRPVWNKLKTTFATASIATVIVVLPLFLFGLKYPGDVFTARSSVSFTAPELNNGKPLEALLDTTYKTALMFNVHGDDNYRHNYGGKPQLNFVVGFFFLIGILLCLRYIYRPRYLALLMIFGAMLVPELVTAEGIPHALRAIGAMPAVFILAALGLRVLWRPIVKNLPTQSTQKLSFALMLLLAYIGWSGYHQYFVAWANSPKTYEAYSEDMVQAAYYMKKPFDGDRYALVHGFGDITILYLTHNAVDYKRLDPHQIDEIAPTDVPKQFVIDQAFRDEAIPKLQKRFPGGELKTHTSTFSGIPLFYSYEVKK